MGFETSKHIDPVDKILQITTLVIIKIEDKILKNNFGATVHSFYVQFRENFKTFYESYPVEQPLFHYLLSGSVLTVQAIKGTALRGIEKNEINLTFE